MEGLPRELTVRALLDHLVESGHGERATPDSLAGGEHGGWLIVDGKDDPQSELGRLLRDVEQDMHRTRIEREG